MLFPLMLLGTATVPLWGRMGRAIGRAVGLLPKDYGLPTEVLTVSAGGAFTMKRVAAADKPAPVADKPSAADKPAPVADKPSAADKPAPVADKPSAADKPAPVADKPSAVAGVTGWETLPDGGSVTNKAHKAQRPIMLAAALRVLNRAPLLAELLYLHAIANLEASYGRGWHDPMIGSFNYGAVQCRTPNTPGLYANRCIPYGDTKASGAKYPVSFCGYATAEDGAAGLAHNVYLSRPGLLEALDNDAPSIMRASYAMRRGTYYEGFCPKATKQYGTTIADASLSHPDRDEGTKACAKEAILSHAGRAYRDARDAAIANGDGRTPILGTYEDAEQWWHARGASAAPVATKGPAGVAPAPAGKLAPALVALVAQLDAAYPHRAKASDDGEGGTEGTEHGDGLAFDVTDDKANGPQLGALALALAQDPRVSYVVWESEVYSRAGDVNVRRPYDFANVAPHNRHAHIAIKPGARDDAKEWALPPAPPAGLSAKATPDAEIKALLAKGVDGLWKAGLIANIDWIAVPIAGDTVKLAARPLALNGDAHGGLYVPLSWREELALCVDSGGQLLPVTDKCFDLRRTATGPDGKALFTWVVVKPFQVEGAQPDAIQEPLWEAEINKIAPGRGGVGGAWKEWVYLLAGETSEAVNYGLASDDHGTVIQTRGHKHNKDHKGYSQLCAPMYRYSGAGLDMLAVLTGQDTSSAAKALCAALGGPVVLPPELAGLLPGKVA